MTYTDPPTMPAMYPPQQQYPPVPAPARRPRWPWVAGALAACIAVVVVAIAVGGDPGKRSATPAAPEPITRAELVAKYADIAPLDRSATPATVDDLAASTCNLLNNGTSTDTLIEKSTEFFQANATAVMQLLVSYKCPEHLADFK